MWCSPHRPAPPCPLLLPWWHTSAVAVAATPAHWPGSGHSEKKRRVKRQEEFLDEQRKIPVEVSPAPDFDDLGESWSSAQLHPDLGEALQQQGFLRPSASQRWAVPLILAGKDVMVCSQTGAVERRCGFTEGLGVAPTCDG